MQAEKRRKQDEAALKAKQAAEEAQKVLEALKGREGSTAGSEVPPAVPLESANATPAPEQGQDSTCSKNIMLQSRRTRCNTSVQLFMLAT